MLPPPRLSQFFISFSVGISSYHLLPRYLYDERIFLIRNKNDFLACCR